MDESTGSGIGDLADENRRLKKKLVEMEEQLRRERTRIERESAQATSVVKLLKQKDSRIGAMADDIEDKNEQLEDMVARLQKKNDELQLWISSLRLYQDIFENEPAVMIGTNAEARIILFNKAASDHFGDTIRGALMKEVETLDFRRLDPYVPTMVRQALKDRRKADRKLSRDGEEVATWIFPIASGNAVKGVLLKIGVLRR